MPRTVTRRPSRTAVLEPDDPQFIDDQEKAEHRAALIRRARELKLDPKLVLRAEANGFAPEQLTQLEFYKGSPIFTEPPEVDDPLRKLIDLGDFTRDDVLAWLKRQPQVEI